MLNRFAVAVIAMAVFVALVAESGPSSSPQTAVSEPLPKHTSSPVAMPDFTPDTRYFQDASVPIPAVTAQQPIPPAALEESRKRAGSSDKNGD